MIRVAKQTKQHSDRVNMQIKSLKTHDTDNFLTFADQSTLLFVRLSIKLGLITNYTLIIHNFIGVNTSMFLYFLTKKHINTYVIWDFWNKL